MTENNQCPYSEEITVLLNVAKNLTWCEHGLNLPREDCEIRVA